MKHSTLNRNEFHPEDCMDISQSMNDELTSIMDCDYGINADDCNLEIGYSLGYSQGDGVSFTAGKMRNKDVEKLLKKDLPIFPDDEITVEIYNANRHYMNECSFRVEVYYEPDDSEKEVETSVLDDIENDIKTELRSVCKKLEKYGYETIEDMETEDFKQAAFEDFCKLNNIETDESLCSFSSAREGEKDFILVWVDPKNKKDYFGISAKLERKERTVEYYVFN